MIADHILLRMYLRERNVEGLQCIRELVRNADTVQMAFLANWITHHYRDGEVLSALEHRFNLLELRIVNNSENKNASEISLRYRPSPQSDSWMQISPMDEATIDSIGSEKEHRNFNLWLNLSKFTTPCKLDPSTRENAVLELLAPILVNDKEPPNSIDKIIRQLFPNLIDTALWGYADILPMRDLSIEEEWFVARTDVFWRDLAATQEAHHQYLIKTSTGVPRVPLPPRRTLLNGHLSVYSFSENEGPEYDSRRSR